MTAAISSDAMLIGGAIVAHGVHVTRVYRWTYPRERGGSDGAVPTRHQAQLLRGARERGIDLTPADFFDREPAGADTQAACAHL